MDKQLREKIALFRFGVIAPLVDRHLSRGERQAILARIVAGRWQIPGSSRTSIGRSTVLKWLSCYRNSGQDIQALQPKQRQDKGRSRCIDPQTEAALVELKRELIEVSLPVLLKVARQRKIIDSHFSGSPQSIYRLFKRHRLEKPHQLSIDRRRFEAELPNDLWQSDAMHGPQVIAEAKLRRSFLFAIIDDHSRLITHAQFYLRENIDCFRDCLIQALAKRGLPRRLYTDNGSAFKSHQLRYGCARLGVALLHSTPGEPEGRGKIERFFRTVRGQLLPLLAQKMDLQSVNRALWDWIEADYHHRKHSTTAQKPLERYLAHLKALRAAPADLHDYFRIPVRRKVDKDRTVSLNGRLYEAPPGLIGRTVTLLYHKDRPLRIEVLFEERSYGLLTPLDCGINSRVRRRARQQTEVLPTEEPTQEGTYQGGSLFTEGQNIDEKEQQL